MFYESLQPVIITYPNEAKGWDKGIYTERMPVYEDTSWASSSDMFKIENQSLVLKSLSWTETESTGFGVYNFVESLGFRKATGIKDGKWTVSFKNSSDEELKVSCYANNILKLNAVAVPAGETVTADFMLCSVEDDTLLQFFVPDEAKEKCDAVVKELTITDISYEELPLKAPKAKPTIYLASDSTVQSYDKYYYPQTGWGQTLYRFFNSGKTTEELQSPDMFYPQNHIYETPGFNIENRSIGARSARSFINEGKWDRILALAAPGDYCFIQWGHNDATAVRPNRYVSPEDFPFWLRKYVRSCRERGIQLVLVTPIARRNCDGNSGTFVASFGNYAEPMKKVGAEENIPVIDLCKLSVDYLNEIGPEESKLIYLWAAPGAFPDGAYADGVSDNTHLQEYGATQFAKLVCDAILASDRPELAPLKPAIDTSFTIDKPLMYAPEQPKDETAPSGFAMQELHIENGIASFLLIWNDVPGAVKYNVYRKGSVDFQFFPLRSVSAEEKKSAAVLPFQLPAADVYQVYCEAVFADGKVGAPGRTIEFRA
ncbi:MAG: rhamnogalacturonan acetylesterase [Lachnospiraceae bacterium]|nr:rhamnogalacturonan acetylesterase [Lachnospiraceae bacterium]